MYNKTQTCSEGHCGVAGSPTINYYGDIMGFCDQNGDDKVARYLYYGHLFLTWIYFSPISCDHHTREK